MSDCGIFSEEMGRSRDEDDTVMTDGVHDASVGSNVAAASESMDEGGRDDDEGHDFGKGEGGDVATVAVSPSSSTLYPQGYGGQRNESTIVASHLP